MEDLVSVIVPIYNTEQYIEKCVNSIINQTYKNLEIILIDDGSNDNSLEICEKLSNIDNRIVVKHKQNGGVSSARNMGIDISAGKYIMFTDSDDCIEPDMVSILHKNILEHDLSICRYKKIFLDGTSEEAKDYEKDFLINRNEFLQALFYNATHKYDYQGYSVNKLFRKDIINKNNIRFAEDIFYNEDRLFVYEYVNNSDKGIFFSKYNGYNYIERDNSAMKKNEYNEKMYTEFIAFEKMIKLANSNKNVQDIIIAEYVLHALNMYNRYQLKIYKDIANNHVREVLKSRNVTLKMKIIIIIKSHIKIG